MVDAALLSVSGPSREQLNPLHPRPSSPSPPITLSAPTRPSLSFANMLNGIQIDPAGRHPPIGGASGGLYWRWSQGGVEATAFGLRALLAIDPDNELIDPLMTWLVPQPPRQPLEVHPRHRHCHLGPGRLCHGPR